MFGVGIYLVVSQTTVSGIIWSGATTFAIVDFSAQSVVVELKKKIVNIIVQN